MSMTNLDHSKIDRDFFIKVHGLPEYNGKTTLRSSRKMEQLIGPELYSKFVQKTYDRGRDSITWKLRRGIRLDFYSK